MNIVRVQREEEHEDVARGTDGTKPRRAQLEAHPSQKLQGEALTELSHLGVDCINLAGSLKSAIFLSKAQV